MLHRNAAAWLALTVLALAASEARAQAAPCGTDAFSGDALDGDRWSVLRPADDHHPVVADGRLQLPLVEGALAGDDATARNVVLQHAPTGGWTATARFDVAAADAPGERIGLVLWRAEGPLENAFSTATFTRSGAGTPRFEAIHTDANVAAVPLARSGTDAPSEDDATLRLRSDGEHVTAAFSDDGGASWTDIGERARIGGAVRVGVLALGTGGTATVDHFTLSCGPEVQLTSAPERGTATLEMGINAKLSDDRDGADALELAWDFGDGTTGEGSAARLHKYLRPGTYRPTLEATDSDSNVTRVARTITVLAADPPCPAWSDEFAGNGLDPRWQVRRPVPTGLDVHAGRLWLRPYAGALPGTARNVVLDAAPAGAWTMTTAVDVAALGAPGDQAGLVLWRGDAPSDVAKLVFDRTSAAAHRVLRDAGGARADAAGAPGDTAFLRIGSNGARPPMFSALHSADGTTWAPVGEPFAVAGDGQLKLGVAALGSSVSEPAGFDHLRVEGEQACGAPDVVPPETTHTLDRDPDGAVRMTLAAVDDATGSGIARTEYRVGAGGFEPYRGPVTLAAPGEHAIEYRSIDRAGNAEPAQPLRIAIPGPAPTAPSGDLGPGPAVPRAIGDRRPAVRPAVRITAPRRARLQAAALARRGVRVRVACRAVASVRVSLSVGARAARRLGLRHRTLARRVVRCGHASGVRLGLRGRARRVVRHAGRPFVVTIEARADGAPRDRLRVTIR